MSLKYLVFNWMDHSGDFDELEEYDSYDKAYCDYKDRIVNKSGSYTIMLVIVVHEG